MFISREVGYRLAELGLGSGLREFRMLRLGSELGSGIDFRLGSELGSELGWG